MRFSPIQVFEAHLYGLRNRTYTGQGVESKPDVRARLVLYGLPLVPTGIGIWKKFQLDDSASFLSGVALIVGGLLAVFVQLATSRQKFDRDDVYNAPERDSIDEAVAHILFGVYVALALLVALIVNEEIPAEATWWGIGFTALVIYLGCLLLLVFLLVVPKLWNVYDQENEVPRRMGGTKT